MSTFTDVFERKEVKYHLSAAQHAAMLRALEGHMVPDAYGETRIVSLYLDTPERLLIERSLNKPLYKEKLRLRSYGLPEEDDRVFVEIKKKFDGIVYKRRVGLSYAAARAYLGGLTYEDACTRYPLPDVVMAADSLTSRSLQIAREIDQFVEAYQPLQASMTIDVMRTAYLSVDEAQRATTEATGAEDVRITFDTNAYYRDMFVPLAATSGASLLIAPGEAIMEVKSAGPFPLWLVCELDKCQAYPSSFSKYGEAYQKTMLAGKHLSAVRDVRRRRFQAPIHTVKKGGRCA